MPIANDSGKAGKGKLGKTVKKIIDRKLEIAADILDKKVEFLDGFSRRREQSKEDIRKAALDLFSRYGMEKVSMQDIARKAGVSQATIYNNFGSKDALIREIVSGMVERSVETVESYLKSEKSYRQKLEGFPQFVVDLMVPARV